MVIKRKWDLLSKDERVVQVNELIRFFKAERDEEIGILAAEDILDQFLQQVGLMLYNKGVEDSVNFLRNRLEDVALDVESLVKK